MKTVLKLFADYKTIILLLIINSLWNSAIATTDESSAEKIQAIIQLSFYKKPDQSRSALAKVYARDENGKLVFAEGVKINFYLHQLLQDSLLAAVPTDKEGKAALHLSKDMPVDTVSGITIIARIENDSLYEDTEVESTVKDARMVLDLSENDSSKLITATVTEIQTGGKEIPVENVDVHFGIQRLFGIMPLSDEATVTTGNDGKAVFIFPKGTKGDKNGNIILNARILDDETFGNVEAVKSADWGESLVVDLNPFPRALWEPRAPLFLIISFSIVFGAIWSTYAYVVYQISQIEK